MNLLDIDETSDGETEGEEPAEVQVEPAQHLRMDNEFEVCNKCTDKFTSIKLFISNSNSNHSIGWCT